MSFSLLPCILISYEAPHYAVLYSLSPLPLSPNILLMTLFSDTLNVCPSLSVTDQVSHPYKITGKIIVLHILMFKFWREDILN
jgi:hypothetical protein